MWLRIFMSNINNLNLNLNMFNFTVTTSWTKSTHDSLGNGYMLEGLSEILNFTTSTLRLFPPSQSLCHSTSPLQKLVWPLRKSSCSTRSSCLLSSTSLHQMFTLCGSCWRLASTSRKLVDRAHWCECDDFLHIIPVLIIIILIQQIHHINIHLTLAHNSLHTVDRHITKLAKTWQQYICEYIWYLWIYLLSGLSIEYLYYQGAVGMMSHRWLLQHTDGHCSQI